MRDIDYGGFLNGAAERSAKLYEDDATRNENVATSGNFVRGLKSGIDSTQAMLGGAIGIAGDALGVDAVRDWGFDVYKKNTHEASLNPLDVQNFTDIESVSDTGKWFAGTIGQLAPSVAQGIVSTLVGGAVGTASAGPVGTAGGVVTGMFGRKMAVEAIDKAVASYVKKGMAKRVAEATVKNQLIKKAAAYKVGANVGMIAGTGALEGGGMWGEDAEAHGVENANAWSAAGLGLISGASEIVSPGGMLIKRITGVKGLSKVTDKVADTFLKRIGKEVPQAMGGEAAQEIFQSFLGILNKKIQDPTVSLTDREAIYEYINSGAAGAAGGLLFGVASSVFPEGQATPTAPQKPASPPVEELPKEHTVDDVLDNHNASTAVETAVAREDIQNAGQPDLTANTVGEVLGQPGQGPAPQDLVRLNQEIQEMALSLYPKPDEDGIVQNPAWVKLKTLKDYDKETGEGVSSFVNSKSAKETLKAVLSNTPLTPKQVQVWGYLKGVAENKAMVREQERAGVEQPVTSDNIVEQPATAPGGVSIPAFNPDVHGYGLGDESPFAPGSQEEQGPLGEEPPEQKLQSFKDEVADTEVNGTGSPNAEQGEPLQAPSTEKHEVIDNPDSVAHGQEYTKEGELETGGSTGSNGSNPDTVNNPPIQGDLVVNEQASNTVVAHETENTSDKAPDIIEHKTKKGKFIKGIVRTDLTLAEAKEIDKYTFRKDGGFFIREKHLKAEEKALEPTSAESDEKVPVADEKVEANTKPEEPLVEEKPEEKALEPTSAESDEKVPVADEKVEANTKPEEPLVEEKPKEESLLPSMSKWSPERSKAMADKLEKEGSVGAEESTEIVGSTGGYTLSLDHAFGTQKITHDESGASVEIGVDNLGKKYFNLEGTWENLLDVGFDPTTFTVDERKVVKFFERAKGEIEKDQLALPEPDKNKTEKPAEGKPEYGADNKLFTQEAADDALAILKAELANLNTGLNPKLMQAGITRAGFHIEAGIRSFAQYSKKMVSELGEVAKPFLKIWYNSVRDYPGFDNSGMDDYQAVSEADIENPLTDKPEPKKKESKLDISKADLKALDEEIEQCYKLRECVGA